VRIGKRWINVLWAVLPIGLGLIILIAVAQSLREIPAVEAFIRRYPGVAQAQPAAPGGCACSTS
jgi:methionine sulfoxide reductase catalytic subunit